MADSKKTIANIFKDFDVSSYLIIYTRTGENDLLRYSFGTVYDCDGNLQTVSSYLDPAEIQNGTLPLCCLKVPFFAVVFNTFNNTVYPASSGEIVNFLQNPGGADRLLAVSRYVECTALVICR